MIKFTNGTSITNQQAAALIRREPYGLIAHMLIDAQGHRCALGVLLGSTHGDSCPISVAEESMVLCKRMVRTNNGFHGRPEERREVMAQWFEKLPGE